MKSLLSRYHDFFVFVLLHTSSTVRVPNTQETSNLIQANNSQENREKKILSFGVIIILVLGILDPERMLMNMYKLLILQLLSEMNFLVHLNLV